MVEEEVVAEVVGLVVAMEVQEEATLVVEAVTSAAEVVVEEGTDTKSALRESKMFRSVRRFIYV